MMRWFISSSLRLRRLVVAIAVAVPVLALVQIRNAPVDVYPEFMPPMVQIQTEALGLSAAEVEQLITVPLEQDLLNGVPWLDTIRSDSMTGLSSIDLVFEPGTDVLQARQMVQERLSQAHALPAVGSAPIMIQPLASESRVMMIGLSSRQLSLIEMSVLARWKIKPRLMGIPGVANVAIFGQRDRQLQVQVDPATLRKYGVTLDRVINTTGNALWVSPLTFLEASTPGTGGFVDTANQRFGVQHLLPITTPSSLASVTLRNADGRTLRLGDVANVVEDHQPLIGDAVLKNQPALILVVQKFPGANTRQVTQDLEKAMAALEPGLTGITIDTRLFRPASFIDRALHNVGAAAVIALLLVLALLTWWFLSLRVAVVTLLSTTVSLAAAVALLDLRGAGFNSMVLAGLVVGLVVVIDDAVVSIDAISRRVRERREAGDDRPALSVLTEAALEDRGALLYATCVILLAATPVLVLSGVGGSFGRPLVTSYALAVLASVVVALTVTPALAVSLLSGRALVRGRAGRRVERTTSRTLSTFASRPRAAYACVAVLAIAALAALPQLTSRSLIPAPRDRQLVVPFSAAPGASVAVMDSIATKASRGVRAVPGVTDVGVHVGRAVTSDQIVPASSGELWVTIADNAPYDATVTAIRDRLDGYPEFDHQLATYAEDRLRSASTGTTHPVVVQVYGPVLSQLQRQAEKIRRALGSVAGVEHPRVQTLTTEPTVQIRVRLAAAERYGLKPGDVRRETATLLSGLLVGNLYEEQKIFDVVVWGAPATRNNLAGVQNLVIDTPNGGHVRLGDVASVQLRPSPTVIRHNDVSRSLAVTADVSGRSVGSVVDDVRGRVAELRFPLEYHAEVFDDSTSQHRGDLRILGLAAAAALAILLLLQAATGSWRLATLLLLTLPLAAVGGVLAAPLAGGIMSAGALAGLLAVFALAARQNVVLIRRLQRIRARGARAALEAVVAATSERSAAVLLSALATGVAVLPLAIGTRAGEEVVHPLAVVVLGGLVTSVAMTLLILPTLYLRFVPTAPDQPGTPRIPAARTDAEQVEEHVLAD